MNEALKTGFDPNCPQVRMLPANDKSVPNYGKPAISLFSALHFAGYSNEEIIPDKGIQISKIQPCVGCKPQRAFVSGMA